jgi:hypothetical protein
MPNDPTNTKTDPSADYSEEVNQYCRDTRTNVLEIIEYIYPLIKL